jgi:hypothetical protein
MLVKLVGAYFDGGEGWLVVMKYCCTPVSTEKANLSVTQQKGSWIKVKSWLTNRIDTREWVYPFKGEPLVYLS